MSLQPGTRLGPYEILSALGAGGMGEVYKARDTRLDRTVAVKVLPAQLADDPQFRDRFEREAKAIAALTHPHICTLYDVGHQDSTEYLVMEFLEGETLENRLKKGAVLLDQALKTAIEIASALDKAHRAGIVHRDLKPGNIMLTKSGAKLLDFGLAKATAPVVAGSGLSMLPTTPPNLTAQGTILGTFQYMAPEQLEGQEADARTDIFAFGAVVYEMLTGKKAFEGKSQASLIGAIMHADPASVSSIQLLAPPALDRVVRRCLDKDPDGRWQTARDLLSELEWIARGEVQPIRPPREERSLRNRAWWVSGVAVGCLAFGALVGAAISRHKSPDRIASRLDIVIPPTSDSFSFAISPDGRQLAFVATMDGTAKLWVRSLAESSAHVLPGTDGAAYPFWSPDERSLGFFAESKLKRVDLSGTAPIVLADAPNPRGGSWSRDNLIVYAPETNGALVRIAAGGGSASPLTRLSKGQVSQRWPKFLPDGQHVLFYVGLGAPETRGEYLTSLSGESPVRILVCDSAAEFSPPGYLLAVSQGVLVAYRFDETRRKVTSDPMPLAPTVGVDGLLRAGFSVSATDVLIYRTGTASKRELRWVDRKGKTLAVALPSEDAAIGNPQLSPDGRRIAVQRTVQGNVDIWLFGPGTTRFTFNPLTDGHPVWSPDGRTIAFRTNLNTESATFDLVERPVEADTPVRPLLVTPENKAPLDWSRDGQYLLFASQNQKTRSDLWVLPLSGDRMPRPVVRTDADEIDGQFSPDGQWIAYASDETGRYEVYVRPFGTSGGRLQVSSSSGIYPRWSQDGHEIFFVTLDSRMMVSRIVTSGPKSAQTLTPTTPIELFRSNIALGGNTGIGGVFSAAQYAAAPDGRFLINVTADDAAATPSTAFLNWSAVLDK